MLTAFREVIKPYSVIFFDAYGVLKNAGGAIEGVHQLLSKLREQDKELYVVTNDASRSPLDMALTYQHAEYGDLIPEENNISSGLMASEFLRGKVKSGKVAYLGTQKSAYYIEVAGLIAVPMAHCSLDDDLKALVLLDDEGFDWFRDLNYALNLLRRVTVPVVIANSDTAYPVNGQDVGIGVGALGRMIEHVIDRNFIRFGKPDALMFSYAFVRATAARPGLKKSDVLVVGDTLTTDIVGANAFGLDTALVLSGNVRPQDAATRIASTGIIPTYVCSSIFT